MATVFYAFRDSPQRRQALRSAAGSPERYLLLGLDQLAARGWDARHNLESPASPPAWARIVGGALKAVLERAGGYGGDFATVLASLRVANRADVVFSTVDTVGIPLLLLARARRVRPPLVYVAVGLPERLDRLRGARMRRLYASALARVSTVVAYSEHEAEMLRTWTREQGYGARVEFVPFGVDTELLTVANELGAGEVVSVGADPHRDFELLLRVAETLPETSFRIVATSDRLRALGPAPANVSVEDDLPFGQMLDRLRRARVVALPVLDNSYSGATTLLLQAMALGKPVVVSRTRAIASGYGLVDGENCRLVAPGDAPGFGRALADLLRDESHARALGARARSTVQESLTWERFVDRIEAVLRTAGVRRRE